jgi:hypothetical protein
MVSFQTKNPTLGEFWRALDWKLLLYLMAIWNMLPPFGIFYDHLVLLVFIWYIFSRFGKLCQEKNLATLKRKGSCSEFAEFLCEIEALLKTLWI